MTTEELLAQQAAYAEDYEAGIEAEERAEQEEELAAEEWEAMHPEERCPPRE